MQKGILPFDAECVFLYSGGIHDAGNVKLQRVSAKKLFFGESVLSAHTGTQFA